MKKFFLIITVSIFAIKSRAQQAPDTLMPEPQIPLTWSGWTPACLFEYAINIPYNAPSMSYTSGVKKGYLKRVPEIGATIVFVCIIRKDAAGKVYTEEVPAQVVTPPVSWAEYRNPGSYIPSKNLQGQNCLFYKIPVPVSIYREEVYRGEQTIEARNNPNNWYDNGYKVLMSGTLL